MASTSILVGWIRTDQWLAHAL